MYPKRFYQFQTGSLGLPTPRGLIYKVATSLNTFSQDIHCRSLISIQDTAILNKYVCVETEFFNYLISIVDISD